jgi:hypothetical protein
LGEGRGEGLDDVFPALSFHGVSHRTMFANGSEASPAFRASLQ